MTASGALVKSIVVRVVWPQTEHDPAQWQCECTVDGMLLQPEAGDSLSAIFSHIATQPWSGAKITLVLPAELTFYENVKLPARSQRQAMQALPFVVEEHLADDIENVHLAIGSKQADGAWSVLVIEQELMHRLLDVCRGCQVLPDTVIVDAEALPRVAGELQIVMHEQRVLIRAADVATVAALDDAVTILHLLTKQDAAFRKIHFWHQPDHAQQALLTQQLSTEFAALGDVQTQVDIFTDSLSRFLSGNPFSPAINLLQGPFFIRREGKGLLWWQVAAAVLAFAWIGQTGLQAGSGWYFNQGARKLDRMAEEQYHILFPDARQLSNPRKRLQSRLSAGATPSGANTFDAMFGTSMQAFASIASKDGLMIKQLRYEGKRSELEMEIRATTIDQLDQFKQALDKAGLQAKISSANEAEGGGITGRMQIKAGT
ncbi:MAG TPA: type II secretion system protein GspL [Pseudomonadales bacterium]|nr:type II secretion system protein GspL [Pseudomonadales bacterium]